MKPSGDIQLPNNWLTLIFHTTNFISHIINSSCLTSSQPNCTFTLPWTWKFRRLCPMFHPSIVFLHMPWYEYQIESNPQLCLSIKIHRPNHLSLQSDSFVFITFYGSLPLLRHLALLYTQECQHTFHSIKYQLGFNLGLPRLTPNETLACLTWL